MINLSIKLNRTETKDFTEIVKHLYQHACTLEANEYLHYFNIKTLWKRLFDKQFKGYSSSLLKVNINEFKTLQYLQTHISNENYGYYTIMLQDILKKLDKARLQAISLEMATFQHHKMQIQ